MENPTIPKDHHHEEQIKPINDGASQEPDKLGRAVVKGLETQEEALGPTHDENEPVDLFSVPWKPWTDADREWYKKF